MLLDPGGAVGGGKPARSEGQPTVWFLARVAGPAPFGISGTQFSFGRSSRPAHRKGVRLKPDRMTHGPTAQPSPATTEILIQSDGQVFVHNLTPVIAALLANLNPDDARMQERGTANRQLPKPQFEAICDSSTTSDHG